MRVRVMSSVVVAAGLTASVLMAPGVVSAGSAVEISKQKNECVVKAKTDCSGLKHKWNFKHHGNLEKVTLRHAKPHGADFRGANLTDANLTGANLSGASTTGANFTNAILCMTWMPDAKLVSTNCKPTNSW